ALHLEAAAPRARTEAAPARRGEGFDFLRIPAVWMCFTFFFLYAISLSGVQAFAPEAARLLHEVPKSTAAACLTIYMVASACGMIAGGFLASDPARCERIVGAGVGAAAVIALTLGVVAMPAA